MKKIVGYRTENLINGHYYYGIRTLLKENDPYLGSGLRLKEAIKKYGRHNFKRVDLEVFETFEQALEWERATITAEMVESSLCYNLKAGGAGGSLPWSDGRKAATKQGGLYKKTPRTKEKMSAAAFKRFQETHGTFYGKTHTEETRKKLSEDRKGKPNANKGKKLNLSQERLEQLRAPKSEEVKRKISRTLSTLSEEQLTYLTTSFQDEFGARTKLCREWGVNLDVLARVLGRRYQNKRTKQDDNIKK